jgi:hypothetical protein
LPGGARRVRQLHSQEVLAMKKLTRILSILTFAAAIGATGC